MTFMTLAIFFGIFGLDRMYLGGDFVWQGWAKFLSCFILIGFIWVIHDIFMVLAQPNVVLDEGYPVPLPFNTMYEEWDKTKAKYIGDLFQVTMDPQEKQILEEAAAATATAAGGGAGGGGLAALAKSKMSGAMGKLGGLAKSAAMMTPAGRLAAATGVLGPPQQRGGGEEDIGGATKVAFTAVLLGIGGLAGYSFYKSQT